jgi:hypothetical protein
LSAKAVRRLRAKVKRERHATSLVAELDAIAAGAEVGLKQHDRWLFARTQLLRKLDGRRSTSKLPGLVDYIMSLPIVSAGMIAKALDITPRAAQNLVAELDLREAMAADDTGRGASCERVAIPARVRAGDPRDARRRRRGAHAQDVAGGAFDQAARFLRGPALLGQAGQPP